MAGVPEDLQTKTRQWAHQAQDRLREQIQERWPKSDPRAPLPFEPQALPQQWQEQSQHLAEQAKDQFGQVMNRFRKQSRRVRHQLRETVTDWSEDLSGASRRSDTRADRHQPRRTIDVDPTEVWPEDDFPDSSR
ncbi:hypothetical protein C7271_25425 [filamentous cyanobacterium CCP5]|nr:hypothetical protein C7271_25425 [filamentous cyanobacterium CCP5]